MNLLSPSADFRAFCRLPDERIFLFDRSTHEFEKQHVEAYDFFMGNESLRWGTEARLADASEVLRAFQVENDLDNHEPLELTTPADFRQFAEFFDFAQRKIGEGRVQKLVPFTFDRYQGNINNEQLAKVIRSQLSLPQAHCVFGMCSSKLRIFSITPEYLFWRKGKSVRTMALAGTARLNTNYSDHEFFNDSKEIKEHTFVVLDLLERIQNLKVSKVKKSDRKIKKLKTLAHLWTEIEFEMTDPITDEELVKNLHPTAAMLGYPREASLQIIRGHELQAKRGYFGAPILFQISEQESFCAINIRSVIQGNDEVVVGSGCGIVPQSILQKEWDELAAKRASVLSGMQLL